MTNRPIRLVLALFFSLLLAAGSLAVARAQSGTPPTPPPNTSSESCKTCHLEYYNAWQKGAHSKSRTDHVMQEASNCIACHKNIQNGDMSVSTGDSLPSQSQAQSGQSMASNACTKCHVTGFNADTGKWREDGVACEACHSPIPANHPEQDIPVNKTTDLCRTCHSEARFGWDQWKSSVHFQNNIVCTTCHDSHSTSFKLSSLSDGDASVLCQNCHKDVAKDAQHSAHSNAGVTCIKCHLGEKKGPDDFHKVPDHSFQPKIETCNNCHGQEMHANGSALTMFPVDSATQVAAVPTATPAPKVENINPVQPVTKTPAPVSPVGFIGMAAAMGLVGGWFFSIVRRR